MYQLEPLHSLASTTITLASRGFEPAPLLWLWHGTPQAGMDSFCIFFSYLLLNIFYLTDSWIAVHNQGVSQISNSTMSDHVPMTTILQRCEAINVSGWGTEWNTLWTTQSAFFKSFGLSCEYAKDKDDSRLRIKWATNQQVYVCVQSCLLKLAVAKT